MVYALDDHACIDLLSHLIKIPSLSGEESQIAEYLQAHSAEVFGKESFVRDQNSFLVRIGSANATRTLL